MVLGVPIALWKSFCNATGLAYLDGVSLKGLYWLVKFQWTSAVARGGQWSPTSLNSATIFSASSLR